MALNNLNKSLSGSGKSTYTNFESNLFDNHCATGGDATNATPEENTEMLTELEKMAARELQQQIDEGKRTWKYQTQLTLLWQRYMEDTEQLIRRKVEQIRGTIRSLDKGQLLDRRFSGSVTSTTSSAASKVNYYSGGDDDVEDKMGILLDDEKLEFMDRWSNNPEKAYGEDVKGKFAGGVVGVKINILDEEGNEKEELDDTDETEWIIK